MRTVQNNQVNNILLVTSGEVLTDLQSAVFRQLGSDTDVVIPMTVDSVDCFTAMLHLTLLENQLANATYILKAIDSLSNVLFTFTVSVEGNTDETRAYIIIE